MARTKRNNPNIMSRKEFYETKTEFPMWCENIHTYESYVARVTSDKFMKDQPPAHFRKKLNRKARAKMNQALRSQLAHGEEDPILPVAKRNLRWIWF
jgi:hypothetical protein